jgi:hypothetical protein
MDLQEAVDEIDEVMGEGFAKSNPSFLAAYLHASALYEIDKTLVEAIELAANPLVKLLRRL